MHVLDPNQGRHREEETVLSSERKLLPCFRKERELHPDYGNQKQMSGYVSKKRI